MKKFMKILGAAALMTGVTTGAIAQEQTQEIDKTNFKAQKRIDEAKNNQ